HPQVPEQITPILALFNPILFGAGAFTLEQPSEPSPQSWIKPFIVGLLVFEGIWITPLVVPVLPVSWLTTYVRLLPFNVPKPENRPAEPLIPQHFADPFGWEETGEEVNVAWPRVPLADRAHSAILAQHYRGRGAIDSFGRRY